MHYIALTGGGMLVAGCFLQWFSPGAILLQRGLDTLLGAFVLLSGLVATATALYNIVKNQNRMRYVYLSIGVMCLIIGVYGLLQTREMRITGIVTISLWFVVIGSAMLAGTGVLTPLIPLYCKGRCSSRPEPREENSSDLDVSRIGRPVLFGISGPYAGETIPIPAEGIVVGRDPAQCNLVIQSPSVSRIHARLLRGPSPESLILEDLHSTNGTFFMEGTAWTRISTPVLLSPFKRFRLGDEYNEFEIR